MNSANIWWIRRDIRLKDNQTLHAAIQDAENFIPLFIIEPELMETAAPKRRAFILNALNDLNQQLRDLGSQLIIRQGPAKEAFAKIKEDFPQMAIFAHEDFCPFARERDAEIEDAYGLSRHPGVVLRHPSSILKEDGDPYIVYTPYKNKWYEEPLPNPGDLLPIPQDLPPLPVDIESMAPPKAEEVSGFSATTKEAQARFSDFLEDGIQHYKSQRDRMDLDGTSQLSPYLRFGLLSIREAFAMAHMALIQTQKDKTRAEIRTWMNELIWREFYTTILYHFPNVMEGPFREDYEDIGWREDAADLEAWQKGQTGYPVVDACMRQLLKTGWMHNRGRMIVASFLTKDLLINWQAGEAWFMKNLVDGDPANNNGGWQWTAGTGTDAAPYFRIFNPILQGKKHDPEGEFIAKWVPELQGLPVKFRHEPWEMDEETAKNYDFKLGRDYPQQIVDHFFARDRTLEAYKSARESEGK